MKITVTQQDIDTGIPWMLCGCPIARAIKRATGKVAAVLADNTVLLNPCSDHAQKISLPPEAAKWREDYDREPHVVMSPFSFELAYEVPAVKPVSTPLERAATQTRRGQQGLFG